MSPQNNPRTTIKDLDGLPSGEIDLRIAQSEQRTRDVMDARLTTQDGRLDEMQQDLSTLVGTQKIQGLVQSIKATVEGLVVRGDEWHAEDLTYRSDMVQRVSSIETETKRLTGQVDGIHWFVACSEGIVFVTKKGAALLSASEFWKIVGVGFVLYVLNKVAPMFLKFITPMLHLK